jgi:hypothetical protein
VGENQGIFGRDEMIEVDQSAEAVIASLSGLIDDIKSGKKRLIGVDAFRPVRAKPRLSFDPSPAYKEYELTGELYMTLHFFEEEGNHD